MYYENQMRLVRGIKRLGTRSVTTCRYVALLNILKINVKFPSCLVSLGGS